MRLPRYQVIADELAADIESGRLKPGERLLPQREFAYRCGIAPSTASRIYLALHRKGLVTGEVGRGTYVRSANRVPGSALTEPASTAIDLELNFPILEGQGAEVAKSLSHLMRPEDLATAFQPIGATATPGARRAVAAFLARGAWRPEAESVLFAGNGRQAIAATLSALAPAGSRIAVEALTYPVLMGIAGRLGLELVPIEMDDEGVLPEALAAIHDATALKAIYLQPFLHNPLGVSMGPDRRARIAEFLRAHDIPAVEDAIYSFLVDEEPLAALAPDQVVLIDSFSKRVAPGLGLGMILAGARFRKDIARSLRSGAWTGSGLALAAALRLMADGTAARLQARKRGDAVDRQAIARSSLSGIEVQGDSRAYHLWMELPHQWRAEAYVAAAAKHGISTIAARDFAASAGHAPNAIRLALASPPRNELAAALATLRDLALDSPGPYDVG
jgi:DNA-binding transcriptional MocR family regulator